MNSADVSKICAATDHDATGRGSRGGLTEKRRRLYAAEILRHHQIQHVGRSHEYLEPEEAVVIGVAAALSVAGSLLAVDGLALAERAAPCQSHVETGVGCCTRAVTTDPGWSLVGEAVAIQIESGRHVVR